MLEVIVDIDKAQFNKDRFLQRVPQRMLDSLEDDFLANAREPTKRYHFNFLVTDKQLQELNNYLGPMDKALYSYALNSSTKSKGKDYDSYYLW